MYTVRPPYLLTKYYRDMRWRFPKEEKNLFLTFDDGPIPEITPWVLTELARFQAKATFFCVGENIQRHPELFAQIREGGHSVGNHTYNHLNGWKTDTNRYLENVAQCQELTRSSLFRPPYGKIKKKQLRRLLPQYKVIMWDVLSADFDTRLMPEACLNNVLQYTRKGSIIVFHDSRKAWKNLSYTLPKVVEHFSAQGYTFLPLMDGGIEKNRITV